MDFNKIRELYVDKEIGIIGEDELRRYSVIIPIIEDREGLNVLFEVRAKSLRNQPGEISFPGGKIEANESSKEAAIRETCEELNISERDIEIVGQGDMLLTHHNRLIYSFVAKINSEIEINPSNDEVDHIFKVPLEFFINNEPLKRNIRITAAPETDFPFSDLEGGIGYKLLEGKSSIYFYRYSDYIIWGLTAKILYNFVNNICEMGMKL